MKDKKRAILDNVSLFGSAVVLFNINPLVRLVLTKIVRRINSTLSQKKNTINYMSLSTLIFGCFYFIFPDDYGKLLDQLLFLLLFMNTKLQWKELKSYAGIVSSNTKWVSLAKAFCVSLVLSWKVKYFSNEVRFSKYIPMHFKLFKRYQIILLLLFPLTKISTSLLKNKKDIFELVISLFVSTGLMQRTSDNNIWREIMIVLNTIYYYKYLTIPKFLCNYSFKVLLEAIYTSLIPKSLRENKKLYKRFQCLIISIILINLVKYNQDEDDNFFNRFQRWMLDSINNGALIRTADSMKHHEIQPANNYRTLKDAENHRRRRTSSINRIDPKDVKIYGNDYDLRIYK